LSAAINYEVKRFTDMAAALKELEPFIRSGERLQTGRPIKNFGGMLPREIWANWLLCAAVNASLGSERLIPASQPSDLIGDGLIVDTENGETVLTEHILVPRQAGGPGADIEALILKAVEKKQVKGGVAYASGKTLVVFREAEGDPWLPKRVASRLPVDLAFNAVWVAGLAFVRDGQYAYWVTRLDLRRGNPPVWRVCIAKDFDSWGVEPIQ
jgi:hypothetical protein